MNVLSRLVALGSAAGAVAALAACADNERPATQPGPDATTTATTTTRAAPSSPGGATQVGDIYGPACGLVPQSGEGSAQGMADDPVGTAASNNPLLSTLATAVKAAGLVDTLNAADASYTVFAPADSAFQALPAGTLDQLLADPQGKLSPILTYHVLPERYDADGLARAGELMTVQGERLMISGEKGSLKIDEQEQATVLCGNIPTANATVFVIDKVLMPPAS